MNELVAIDLPPGRRFVEALLRAWDAGNAVLPIDQRLPASAKAELVDLMGAGLVLNPQGTATLQGRPVAPGDAVVVATSGTTGRPKGAVLTHDAVEASAQITSEGVHADPAADTWLACLPLAHIGGLSVVTRALHTGTPLVVHERFDARACEDAARAEVTLVSLVVTALDRIDASLFRRILVGGSAIPTERPENTVATYGMTETGSGVVYDGWALRGVNLRIVDDEILVRSPTLLRCYRDGSVPIDADGWFATGDAGALDANGKLSVRGRIGDVIVTGGEKVWPAQVERAMAQQHWVAEVAVIGRSDPEWGHAVSAVVAPKPGAQVPTLEQVRQELSDVLPRYALPRTVEVVDALPRTAIGKVERRSL